MSHARQVINSLGNKIHNNYILYHNDFEYFRDAENLDDELKEIDTLNEELLDLFLQAQTAAQVAPSNEFPWYLPEPLNTNIKEKLSTLSGKIEQYRGSHDMEEAPRYVQVMCGQEYLYNLKDGFTSIKNGCLKPLLDLDDSPEAKERRSQIIRNVDCVRTDPKRFGKEGTYDKLTLDEQKKYAQVVEYWWNNIKNEGFDANMEFLSKFEEMATVDHNGPTAGEKAAIRDITYSIFCPLNDIGGVDYNTTKDLQDGCFLYYAEKAAVSGRNFRKYMKDHPVGPEPPENAPKNIKNSYKAKLDDAKNNAAYEMSRKRAGFDAMMCRGLNELVIRDVLVNHTDEEGNPLPSRWLSCGEGYKRAKSANDPETFNDYWAHASNEYRDVGEEKLAVLNNKTKEFLKEDVARYNGVFADSRNLDLSSVSYDRDYPIMEKCESLNRLNRMLIDTRNAYIGHDNSGKYNKMMNSLQTVEDLTASKIASGTPLTGEERKAVNKALQDAEKDVADYIGKRAKTSYVHSAGEQRRDLSFAAYSVLNPQAFNTYMNDFNRKMTDDGKDRITAADLQDKYSVGVGRRFEKSQIDMAVERYNSGEIAEKLRPSEIIDLDEEEPKRPEKQIIYNMARMIKEPAALDDYKRMFDVKHTARIIRWNSGLYNDTKKAIEDFQKYRDRIRDRATGRLPEDDAKLEADFVKLEASYKKCQELLPQYCEKVLGQSYHTQGDAAKKSTSAGMMRAAGAGGALDEFLGNHNSDSARHTKQISLKELFNKEMREQKMVDGPDKHRLAADAAASRQKKLDRKNIGPIVP